MTYTPLAWNSCCVRHIWKSLGSRHRRCLFIHNHHQDNLYQLLVSERKAAVVNLGYELVCEMVLTNQESLHQRAFSLKTIGSTNISTIQPGGKITRLAYRNWSCCSRKKCSYRLILLCFQQGIYYNSHTVPRYVCCIRVQGWRKNDLGTSTKPKRCNREWWLRDEGHEKGKRCDSRAETHREVWVA